MTGAALQASVHVDRGRFVLDAAISVAAGETVAVMGPSGAGKSTLLDAIAGLARIASGRVVVGERDVDVAMGRSADGRRIRRVHVPPMARGVVLLGQEPRLFPFLTARDNVAFGARARGVARTLARTTAEEWLWRVGLDGMGGHRPAQLSGGQQQRVAIARALATAPRAVLLDEPLTSLDPETADGIRAMLHEQLTATRTTAVVTTHTALDAVALARRLIVLEAGRVTQTGEVREVLAAPATRFVAAVSGHNRLEGSIDGGHWRGAGITLDATDEASRSVLARGGPAAAIFRPGAVILTPTDAATWTAALRLNPRTRAGEWLARVARLEQTPAGVRVRTEHPEVAVDMPADEAAGLALLPGTPVLLRVAADHVRLQPTVDFPGEPPASVSARR